MTDEKLPEFVEPVIITDNVTLQSITANGITVDWPITAGTATQALLNDGLGHLYWGAGGGGDTGNVSTAQVFTSTNSILVTDTTSSPTNIKQSLVRIDTSGNISNANILTSNYIIANNDITVSSANKLRLSDATNTYAVSLLAPNTLSNNYQLVMPAGAPATLQSLRTSLASASQYEWFSPYSSQQPAISRCIYVANGGSDTTGTGSLDQPFASIARAITIANTLAIVSNPVVIQVQPGVYIENNTIGALTITAAGVTICGLQSTAVIIQPLVRSNVLFSFIVSVQLSNLTISSGGVSTAAAINITGTGNSSSFNTIQIVGFYTGIYCSTGTSQSLFRNLLIRSCTTSIYVNNCIVIAISLVLQGSTTSTPANTGIYTTGAIGKLLVSGGAISNCVVALSFANGSLGGISSLSSVANVNDLTVSSGSTVFVSAVQYTDGTTLNDVTISVSGASTVVELSSCNIDGYDYVHGTVSGTGISCTLGATVLINSSIIQRYANGVAVGINTDVSNTKMTVSDVFFTNNTVDIVQLGTSELSVSSSTMSLSKLSIMSPDNVSLSFSDETTGTMSIGSTAATPVILSQPLQSLTNCPTFGFTPSMYNTSSFIEQSTNGLMHSVVSSALSGYAAVTQNRAMSSVIRLASDTYTPTGTTNALRYWDISKNNSTHASLDFTFGNTDTNGLAVVTPFVFAEFDAVDLTMTLAPSAKIVLQDTISSCDLYVSNMLLRSSIGLFVSGNITASGLTSGYALYAGANGLITSSSSSAIELGYLTGVTSSIQTQLNSKFSTSGGTLTNGLVLPMGSVSSMPLGFTGSTAGIYALANTLSIGISGSTVASFAASGLTLQLASGVLHSSSGLITSSLIVGTDIATNANISNSSLATLTASGLVANSATTATSANTPSSIVTRDASGGFSVGTITLLNSVVNATDAATKSYVDSAVGTGFTPRTPANVLANSNVTLSGLPIIDSYQLVAGSRVLLISQLNQVQNGLYVAAAGAWSRPSDFATGAIAGSAYVLITNGNVYTGSSYICNTPNAIIDTNNILFVEFSLPVTVSGDNIGSGTGLVYYGTSGDVLSFKTLATGANCTIINGLTDITIGVNSTNLNTANAIVSRDISGDFSAGTITANLTGVASGCLALTGGTLTGQLALISGTSSIPALSFSSALTSGLFYSSGVCVSASGSIVSTFSSNGLSINIAGTSTVPSLSIVGNVGFSAYQLNTLSAIINNSDVASFAPNGLVVREGSVLNPSISFYGNLDTGFSHGNGIAVSVDSALVAKFTSSNLQLPLSTSGILYTDSIGNVNSAATIANNYTTATSVNIANTIVSRNVSGDFSAGTITASLTGVASGCLALTGGTLTGQLVVPVGTSGSNSIVFGSSLTGIYSVTSGLALVTNSTQKIYIDSTGYIQLVSYGVGILHSDASGIISSSLIIGADIATNANISNSSLATLTASNLVANSATTATSLNTSSAIVSRDTLGNFAAGTITANLIGNVTGSASGCLPLTGGILTGSLILPAGSSASPSLTFTSSTTSGFSCEVANVISVDISNISVVRFSSNGLSLPGITVNHILYTNATGIISDVTIGAGLSFSSGILTSTGTTYTPGTGVNISSNVISIGQDVATTSNVQFASVINSTIGTGNQIFGTSSLSNASSSGNVAIGASALSNGTACSNNIVIGNSSGLLVTTGINNVLLGAYTTLASASNSNSIVIGYNAIGKGSNTAVYGNSGITQHYFTSGMLFADGLTLTNISPNIGIAYINGGVLSALTPTLLTTIISGISPSFNSLTTRGLTINTLANGLLKTSSGVVVLAVPGVDYQMPMSGSSNIIISGNTISLNTISTFNTISTSVANITNANITNQTVNKLTVSTVTSGILKSNSGVVAQAIPGSDYQEPLTASGALSISNNVISNFVAYGCFSSTFITSSLIYWNNTVLNSNVNVLNQTVTFITAGIYEVVLSGSVISSASLAMNIIMYINGVQYPPGVANTTVYWGNTTNNTVYPLSFSTLVRVSVNSTMYFTTTNLQGNSNVPTYLTVKWLSQ